MVTLKAATVDTSNTINEEQPFFFTDIWGETYWDDDDRLVLEEVNELWGTSGRFYMIVKPDWEVRMRIRTKNWGYFKEEDFTSDIRDAYDMTFDTPLLTPPSGWKSSMTATFRGLSMLAVAPDGDKGKWNRAGSTFDTQARSRNAFPPEVLFQGPTGSVYGANGMLMSLSGAFGNYNTTRVKNWRFNPSNTDMRIDMVWARQSPNDAEIIPQLTPDDALADDTQANVTVEPYIELREYSRTIRIASGIDANGDSWEVNLRLNTEEQMWYIFVDGHRQEGSWSEQSEDGYEQAVEAAYAIAEARRKQAKVKDKDKNKNFTPALALGVGAGLLVILGLVILAVRK